MTRDQFVVALDYGMWAHQKERYLEVEGVAEALGVKTDRLLAINFIYEMIAYCTSLIGRDEDGTVMLFRTLDFSAPEFLKKTSYVGDFYKGGKKIYSCVLFGGALNCATAFKQDKFAISLNQRSPSGMRDQFNFLANIGYISNGTPQVSSVIRDALENCDDYQCAYNKLTKAKISGSAYYIIAGINKNEGAVITRSPEGALNVAALSDTKWYLVETNEDHYQGNCRSRCRTANENFEKLTQSRLTKETGLSEVLQQVPNLNVLSIYHSVIVPKTGYFKSFLANGTVTPDDF